MHAVGAPLRWGRRVRTIGERLRSGRSPSMAEEAGAELTALVVNTST